MLILLILGRMKTAEIRRVNDEIKILFHNTTGIPALQQKILTCGNRKNLLAHQDQTEISTMDTLFIGCINFLSGFPV